MRQKEHQLTMLGRPHIALSLDENGATSPYIPAQEPDRSLGHKITRSVDNGRPP